MWPLLEEACHWGTFDILLGAFYIIRRVINLRGQGVGGYDLKVMFGCQVDRSGVLMVSVMAGLL